MPEKELAAPTRAEVEARWQSLIEGRSTRQEVHEWAVPWVEHHDHEISDPMVLNGLQHLHGFDLTYDEKSPNMVRHGPGHRYVHSEQDIASSLQRWRANCATYDADPEAYVALRKRLARSSQEIVNAEDPVPPYHPTNGRST